MQGSEITANPQQAAPSLQATPDQSLQPAGDGAAQAGSSASSALQSPASTQQTELFLRGETAGQRVSGGGEFMPPAVTAVMALLILIIGVLAIVLFLQRRRRSNS